MAKSIYVGNLSYDADDEAVRSLFAQYGNVLSAKVIMDRDTGRSRGFGFVEMDEADAAGAIEALDGTDMMGRSLKVNEAKPREPRPPRRW